MAGRNTSPTVCADCGFLRNCIRWIQHRRREVRTRCKARTGGDGMNHGRGDRALPGRSDVAAQSVPGQPCPRRSSSTMARDIPRFPTADSRYDSFLLRATPSCLDTHNQPADRHTKPTIAACATGAIGTRTIKPRHPVELGLCNFASLERALTKPEPEGRGG